MNPYKDYNFREILQGISKTEFEEKEKKAALLEYEEFEKAFKCNICYLCKNFLNSFVKDKPCLHWLLLPVGITKKDLLRYLNTSEISFYKLEAYLRWVASTETPFININDSEENKRPNVFFSKTIRFRNIEWALFCSNSDKEGHIGSKEGDKPHWHIQIYQDKGVFIKFTDCHIQFSDKDLFFIEAKEKLGDDLKFFHFKGLGLSEIEHRIKEESFDRIDKETEISENQKTACIMKRTIITAKKGHKISVDDINEAIEKHINTKESLKDIIAKKTKNLEVKTIISPSDNFPEMIIRNQRKKKKI
jgi:hypothetical protein